MPYLSLPTLSGYLRQNGCTVDQWDLNLLFYEEAFSMAYLQTVFQSRRHLLSLAVQEELSQSIEMLHDVEQAKDVFKTEAFYDYSALMWAERTLEKVYACFSLLYPGTYFSKDYFRIEGQSITSSQAVIQAAQNTLSNPFIDFFNLKVLPRLNENTPHLVGFSIAREYQMIPTFTFAYLIRQCFPEIHLTVGGAFFSKIADGLKKDHHPAFSTLVHSAVKGEGEDALLKLVKALGGELTLEEVPGLIYNTSEGLLKVNPAGLALSMNDDIGTPDFEGLDLKNYWSADLVLPILGSRDCYWKDCTFCDHYMQFSGFRSRKPQKIAEDMSYLQQKHGVKHFQFCDETMSPNFGRRLAAALQETDTHVHWYTMARLQKGFDAETADIWRQSGCLFILMGLESANAELARSMVKGTDNSITEAVLKNLHEAGIFTFAFLFFGFPGETLATATETVQFIRKNQRFINSLGSGVFYLQKSTPVFRNHQAFGLIPDAEDLQDDWACVIRFQLQKGMDTEQAILFHEKFREEMGFAYRAALWQKIPRIAFFLYLSRYGKQKVLEHNGLSALEASLEQVRQFKQQGNAVAAAYINQSVLKKYTDQPLAANRAAYFALEQHNLSLAEYWWKKAQTQGPHLAETYLLEGLILQQRGQLMEAVRAFENALQKDVYLVEAYLALAEIYHLQNNTAEKRRHAQEALKIYEVEKSLNRFSFYTPADFAVRYQAILPEASIA